MKKRLVGLVLTITAVLGAGVVTALPAGSSVASAGDHWCC
jgi:hypothetical protein